MKYLFICLLIILILCCKNTTQIEETPHLSPTMIKVFAKDSTFIMKDLGIDTTQKVFFTYDFEMGAYEVSQSEFKSIMGFNESEFKGEEKPVTNLSWYCAIYYCNELSKLEGLDTVYSYTGNPVWGDTTKNQKANNLYLLENISINYQANGYRLPTEAEWEYSCRAGTTTLYFWGDQTYTESINVETGLVTKNYYYADYAVWKGGYYAGPSDIGSKKPNGFGLYDMLGNVGEYCNDWYASYVEGAITNPTGPDTGEEYRSERGGCWYVEMSSAERAMTSMTGFGSTTGFRVVRGVIK